MFNAPEPFLFSPPFLHLFYVEKALHFLAKWTVKIQKNHCNSNSAASFIRFTSQALGARKNALLVSIQCLIQVENRFKVRFPPFKHFLFFFPPSTARRRNVHICPPPPFAKILLATLYFACHCCFFMSIRVVPGSLVDTQ